MKTILTYVFCLMLVVVPVIGCVSPTITDDQYTTFVAEVDAMERDGTLTEAEADTLREWAFTLTDDGGGVDWDRIGEIGLGMLGAVVAALTGVRVVRGPAKPVDKSQGALLSGLLDDYRRQKSGGGSSTDDPSVTKAPA